ncbi:MAG: hypothetical protein BWX86_02721 [Verrucomicrobia bacterium ADurb.Bin122]|nr:MAG: hypothetical protein BWX86_02721 [Verrucomicrobia bacterium ADurb.Bin122]
MAAARSEGLAHGEVLGAAAGADQQKIGEVDGADDHQQEAAGLKQEDGGADRAHVVGVEPGDGGVEPDVFDELRHGIVDEQSGIQRIDLGLRILDRGPGGQAGDHLPVVRVPVGGFALF